MFLKFKRAKPKADLHSKLDAIICHISNSQSEYRLNINPPSTILFPGHESGRIDIIGVVGVLGVAIVVFTGVVASLNTNLLSAVL